MFDIIKSYLVELGVYIDQPGFNEMNRTLNATGKTISSSTTGWTKDFTKAGAIIATAITAINSATVGLMANIAKQDLEMEKYARSMMIGKAAAAQMKTAVDALGHSIQDIAITPELRNQYAALINDAGKMTLGGDFETQAKNMRQVMFEFTRLKQEASYALQWIGYYLYKNLTWPLGDIRQKFKGLNDSLIKNMPVWTKKVADGLTHIINIGQAAIRLIKNVTGYLGELWDSFPRGVKIATAALTALFTFISVGPVGKFTMLLSAALLLIEDFFSHIDGKESAFGPVWDKLIEYAGSAEIAFDELKTKAVELFNEITNSQAFKVFVEKLEKTGTKLYNLAESGVKFLQKTLSNLFRQIEQSGAVKEFIEMILELASALYDLAETIIENVVSAIVDLYEYLDDTGSIDNISEAIKSLWNGIISLGKGFANLLKETKRYFDYIKSQDSFKEWWNGLKQVLKGVVDIAASVLTHLGNIGKAVGLLMQGKFKEAAKTFGDSYIDNMKKAFGGLGDIAQGGWGMIKGSLKGYGDMVKYFTGKLNLGGGGYEDAGLANTKETTKANAGIASELLKQMGYSSTVSSGWRSEENNKAAGGAQNSYHLHGDAIDFVFDEYISQEVADEIVAKIKSTGLFKEVLFHDVGSGAHLHVGGAKADASKSLWEEIGNISTANKAAQGMGNNSITYSANALATTLQQERNNADPRLTASIMNGGTSNSAIYNNGGNTTVHLNLGDVNVNVAQTNASPQEIGNAVRNGISTALPQAQYMLLYRSVGGIA